MHIREIQYHDIPAVVALIRADSLPGQPLSIEACKMRSVVTPRLIEDGWKHL